MSPWRTRTFRTVAVVLAVVLGTTSVTWAAPPNLQISLLSSDSLTASQRQRIDEYAAYWAGQLDNPASTPAEAAEAAAKLIEPATSPGTRSTFRMAYASTLLPKLTEILSQNDQEFRSVQAAKVMGFLGTPDALEELVQWCSIEDEPRMPVRLWAARGCEVLIRTTQEQNIVNEREVNGALRALRQAAEREESWLVLHRLFEAMAAGNNQVARQRQLEAFESVVRRMEDVNTPSELMRAATRAMLNFRNQFMRMGVNQQSAYGKELGPMLGRVNEIASDHWEQAQQDDSMRNVYGQAVQISESLLKLIDQSVRLGAGSPSTTLYSSWQQRNRPQFQSDVQSWSSVLQGPQYSN